MTKKKEPATGELVISLENYQRSRDGVIVALSNVQRGLAHVQSGLNDLMNAYIKHSASVLAGEDGALESLQLPENIAETANAAMAAADSAIKNVSQAVTTPASAPPVPADVGKSKKRKREKKEKDPNQPKRPLTAAFLYAQQARPVVKGDLENELKPGQKLEPNAVNFEVNKRWNELPEEEKEQWKASYRESMKQWKEDNAAYLASKGEPVTEELHVDDDISDEAETGALDSDVETEDEEDAVVEPSPVAKAATPPTTNGKNPRANKRQKTAQPTQTNGATVPVPIAPVPTPVPLPVSTRQPSQVPPPATLLETPAKKDKKRKEKAATAPQPIAPKETSPDDTKKKGKTGRTTRNADIEADVQEKEKENKPVKKRDRSKRKIEAAAA